MNSASVPPRPPLVRAARLLAACGAIVALSTSAVPAKAQRPDRFRDPPRLVSSDAILPHAAHVYRSTPQGELSLHFSLPAGWMPADRRPTIVFFGDGLKNGSFTQFVPQADSFASRGMVAVCADYRIASVDGTTPDACVEDAKAAVRWLREHAAEPREATP